MLPRLQTAASVGARAADALQAQVVRVLAEVDELDDRRAGLDRPAREDEAELLRRDLDACRGRRGVDHFSSAGRGKAAAPGMIAFASTWSHCSSRAA